MNINLEQLESFEKETGISIFTALKAITQGIYKNNPHYGIEWCRVNFIGKQCLMSTLHSTGNTFSTSYFYKDYGRTWALTREELEQNN